MNISNNTEAVFIKCWYEKKISTNVVETVRSRVAIKSDTLLMNTSLKSIVKYMYVTVYTRINNLDEQNNIKSIELVNPSWVKSLPLATQK